MTRQESAQDVCRYYKLVKEICDDGAKIGENCLDKALTLDA